MQHVIFIYYTVSLASGFAGIALAFFHYLKVRRPIAAYYLGIIVLFTAYMLLLNVHYYQRMVVALDSPAVHGAAEIVFSLALGCLFYLAPAALHRFFEKRMSRSVAIVLLCFALLPLLELAAGFLLRVDWRGPSPAHLLMYLLAGYCLIFIARHSRGIGKPKAGMARLLLAGVIAFLLAQLADDLQALLNPGHYPITALPLYYLLCNAASVVIVFRNFARPPAPDGTRLEAAMGRFNITGREREVIGLILEGCANKEIAARLGVSFSTVKNHVYNIFRKTGARGKIELMRRLADG